MSSIKKFKISYEIIVIIAIALLIVFNNSNIFSNLFENQEIQTSYRDLGYYTFFIILSFFSVFNFKKIKELPTNKKYLNSILFAASIGFISYFILFTRSYGIIQNVLTAIFVFTVFSYLTKYFFNNINNKIIFHSNIAIIFSIYIFHPFSDFYENQINYFPQALINQFGNLENDFTANTTPPYPAFNYLVKLMWYFFESNTIFYLNIFSIAIFVWSMNILAAHIFKPNISLILFYLMPLLFSSYLMDAEILFSHLNRYSIDQIIKLFTYGLSTNRSFSTVFEPTSFDILVIPIFVLASQGKWTRALYLSAFVLQFHFSLLVPTGFLILYLIYKREIFYKSIRKSLIAYFLSVIFIFLYSQFALGADKTMSELSDNIMTNEVVPMHRLITPTLTFGIYNGETPAIEFHREKIGNKFSFISVFNDSTHRAGKSVSFEADRLLFYVFALVLLKDIFIKRFFYFSLLLTVFSMIFVVLFRENLLSGYIKDLVPWRITGFLALISSVVLLGKIVEYIVNKSIFGNAAVVILFLTIPIQFYQAEYNSHQSIFNNYQSKFHQNLNMDHNLDIYKDKKFLIPPDKIYFSLHNRGLASTVTRYHPYNKNEIVDWYRVFQETVFVFQGNECESLITFATSQNADVIYLPKDGVYYNPYLLECQYKNSIEFDNYNLIILEN